MTGISSRSQVRRWNCPSASPLALVAAARLLDRVRVRDRVVLLRETVQLAVVLVQRPKFLLGEILDVEQSIARALDGGDDLVELQVDCARLLVLRALNQE